MGGAAGEEKAPRAANIPRVEKKPDSGKERNPGPPTRSKAAREPLAPIAPALEQLLNPGIAKGTAGVGSQTGLNPQAPAAKRPAKPLPGGERVKDKQPPTGLRPPADNSWDRREDFSAAHRARKSVNTPLPSPPPQGGREQTERGEGTASPSGFSESPQAQYTSDAELIEASPELARALGLD